MKRKIKIIDATNKSKTKLSEAEVTIRATDHFEAQRKYKAVIFTDRRKRKPKYKKNYLTEE